MREGSVAQIRSGSEVRGRDNHVLGEVVEVVIDEDTDIFVGVTVRPNLASVPLLVPRDAIQRLHEGVLYVDALPEELRPLHDPGRHAGGAKG